MMIELRNATETDIELIEKLRSADRTALGFIPINSYRQILKFKKTKQRLIVCELENKVVGFCYYSLFGTETKIFQLTVLEQFRGRGIASKLIDHVKNETEHQVIRIRVLKSLPALQFWLKRGFEVKVDDRVCVLHLKMY